VSVRVVDSPALERTWSGSDAPPAWETILGDGLPLTHEVGSAGDHRFRYGPDAFHLSVDGSTILCAPKNGGDMAWRRQLLDTVLFSASFVHGFELLHASAVESEEGVVAFVAASGGGKSSLAAELLRRGMPLFCDDVLALRAGPDGVVCFPAPAVMNVPSAISRRGGLWDVVADMPGEDESWVAVRGASTDARPLAAVYFLDRNAPATRCDDLESGRLQQLLGNAISLPHDLDRARGRFGLFSEVAASVPMRRLSATPGTSPSALADIVEASLGLTDAPMMAVAL
jgi:hypothetical protein